MKLGRVLILLAGFVPALLASGLILVSLDAQGVGIVDGVVVDAAGPVFTVRGTVADAEGNIVLNGNTGAGTGATLLATVTPESGTAATGGLTAGNEVAVEAFLEGRLEFPAIAALIASILAKCPGCRPDTLEEILQSDGEARRRSREKLADFDI